MSAIRKAVEDYLALRRALGYQLIDNASVLRRFVGFLERKGVFHITTDLAVRWMKQAAKAHHPARSTRCLAILRDFARYRAATDPLTEIPPEGLFPFRYSRSAPHLYTEEEISRLLKAAKQLPSLTGLRSCTYVTLLGLLVATGMRSGEALRLSRDDVDFKNGILTIRLTKFKKSRLVPLHSTTVAALHRYAFRRDRAIPRPASSRFFVSVNGRPLSHSAIGETFRRLSRQIGLRGPTDRVGPRLHDFRHRFAVTTLMKWYRCGQDVEQLLPTLSTYLGHVYVSGTYWYLSAVPELLCLSAKRLEKRWEDL